MTDFPSRVDSTARLLLAAAREAQMALSGDLRVSETDAAALLGLSVSRLRALRYEGGAPECFAVGLNGCRRSFRLTDLAAWIEMGRESL